MAFWSGKSKSCVRVEEVLFFTGAGAKLEKVGWKRARQRSFPSALIPILARDPQQRSDYMCVTGGRKALEKFYFGAERAPTLASRTGVLCERRPPLFKGKTWPTLRIPLRNTAACCSGSASQDERSCELRFSTSGPKPARPLQRCISSASVHVDGGGSPCRSWLLEAAVQDRALRVSIICRRHVTRFPALSLLHLGIALKFHPIFVDLLFPVGRSREER